MPPVPTSRFALRRAWTAFALLAAAGCGDNLAGPRSEMCDDQLAITTTEAGVIRYLVAVTGEAVVNRVTYTTPAGDTTLVNPEDEAADELLLRRDIHFSEAVEATIRVQGEVASTGEIGFTYAIVPDDLAKDVILGPTTVCNTATQ